ncbi:NfeD family protein [Legionella waltersii]|nr:NfeD family protein [Legionella waltersii]
MMEWLSYWHWFALALILVIAESLGTAGFLVAIGMAAGIVGLVLTLFAMTWEWQLTVFSIMSIVFAFIWWKIIQKRSKERPVSTLNRPIEAMVGRTTTLIEPIENGRGKIRMNDATWFVTGPELEAGTKVKITGVDNETLLIVEQLRKAD